MTDEGRNPPSNGQRRKTLPVWVCIAVAFMFGCVESTVSTGGPLTADFYTLVAIDGQPLPDTIDVQLPNTPIGPHAVEAARLMLASTASGTWLMSFRRVPDGVNRTTQFTFLFQTAGDSIEALPEFAGRQVGDTLTLYSKATPSAVSGVLGGVHTWRFVLDQTITQP